MFVFCFEGSRGFLESVERWACCDGLSLYGFKAEVLMADAG